MADDYELTSGSEFLNICSFVHRTLKVACGQQCLYHPPILGKIYPTFPFADPDHVVENLKPT